LRNSGNGRGDRGCSNENGGSIRHGVFLGLVSCLQ
jgi:hypothetical protein